MQLILEYDHNQNMWYQNLANNVKQTNYNVNYFFGINVVWYYLCS